MIRKHNRAPSPRRQQGLATLLVTLLLLGIITVFLLFSTNVSFFEQRTVTNENRSQITEQMAEYAANLAGEFLNANRAVVVNTSGSGWLASGTRRWVSCASVTVTAGHPCASERDLTRRAGMYFYDSNPATAAVDAIPYSSLTAAQANALTGTTTGGVADRFTGTVAVNALLCRIGYTNTGAPACQLNPTTGNNVAITVIATSRLTGESSSSTIKETWATAIPRMPSATVPLIASGSVMGLGNAQIVASPNAGGYGIPASIWSPNNVDIGNDATGCGGGGVGSVSTCHIGEYLKTTPRDQLKTTCATSNNACGCPSVSASGVDFLSGHSQSVKVERGDILDADSDCGSADITFFPSQHGGASPKDDDTDPTDDSLFEYIFDVANVVDEDAVMVNTNCGAGGNTNCAAAALVDEFNATVLSNCSSLGTTSSGIYYVTGDCDLNSTGSPTSPVIIVVDGSVRVNGNVDFYGMLFVRSNDTSTTAVRVNGTGNVKIFGSLVVEGSVDLHGSIDLIYDNTNVAGNPGGPLPASARFGKVSGSWLDSQRGI